MKEEPKKVVRPEKNAGGFTLVEMALTMVVLGVLIAIGAAMIGPMTKRARQVETTDILNGAVEAISGYANVNKRLPIWHNSHASPDIPQTNEIHYVLRNRNDAWGGPLFYRFANNPDLSSVDVCSVQSTNLAVTRCSDGSCSTPQITRDVAFIIYSRGANGNYQTILPGPYPPPPSLIPPTLPSPYPAGIYTAYIYEQGISMLTNRVSSPPAIPVPHTTPAVTITDPTDSGCAANEDRCRYDDVVKFMTLAELKTKIGCTRYDLCSTGISVLNESGGGLYYRRNGGTCSAWSSAGSLSMTSTDGYQVYTDAACSAACSPQGSMTYSQQKDIDVNNNCQTRIRPGCLMTDR